MKWKEGTLNYTVQYEIETGEEITGATSFMVALANPLLAKNAESFHS